MGGEVAVFSRLEQSPGGVNDYCASRYTSERASLPFGSLRGDCRTLNCLSTRTLASERRFGCLLILSVCHHTVSTRRQELRASANACPLWQCDQTPRGQTNLALSTCFQERGQKRFDHRWSMRRAHDPAPVRGFSRHSDCG